MNLLFFGQPGRQLFGAYHEPSPGIAVRGAAVLCPPWGPEYFVSHRIYRRLAIRLSEAGYHVLRFDYYGTGDSAGERTEGDLASWYGDASLAVDELRDMSGLTEVVAFGIRLGAVTSWRLAMARTDVRTVVLWDPVIDGSDYLKELATAHAEIERWSLTRGPRRSSAHGVEELLGMPLPAAMRASIETVVPAEFERPIAARVKVFQSDRVPAHEQLQQKMLAAGTSFHVETMPLETPWRETEDIGAGRVPHVVLERMVEVLQ
jgi:pimeloyl-ACP methyl ester carboxylesterase